MPGGKISRVLPSPDMADESLLRQSWALYKQGRFAAAMESLEPRIFQFREEPAFFRVLGLCCLRLGDWKGGETYLQRSRQLEGTAHRDTLLGLMAVSGRQGDYGNAAKIGLELLDRDPADRTAKKILARLRVVLGSPEGGPGIDRDTLAQWLPPYKKKTGSSVKWVIRTALVLGGAACIAGGIGAGLGLMGAFPTMGGDRPGPLTMKLPLGASDTTLTGAAFILTLTPGEVQSGWDRARQAFQDYKDSRARYEINRLLLSNAAPSVKERARALVPYLHEPDFSRSDDSSDFPSVSSSPQLYEGCTVRWSGVLANLVSGDRKITFDLLLGYQDGQVVQGVVPVELGFAALLKNSQVIEVLGRVAFRENHWFIQGTSLRNLGYRTQ